MAKESISGISCKIPINHCESCDRLFIGKNSLSILQKQYGLLLLRTQSVPESDDETNTFDNFNQQSELYSYGYNVIANKFSTAERQSLLRYLLEHDLMSKFQIRRDIENAINLFSRRTNYESAVKLWQDDLLFVDMHSDDTSMT